MIDARRDLDAVAFVQAEFLLIEPDVHAALRDIRDLLAHMGFLNLRRPGMRRDLHQAKLDGAVQIGGQQLVDHAVLHAAQMNVVAFADDQILRHPFALKELEHRDAQGCRDGFQRIDGGIDRVLFNLAEHGRRHLRPGSQLPQRVLLHHPVLLYLCTDVDFFHKTSRQI